MGKKPGFKINVFSDTFVYVVIAILIFAFVLFMPSIYKFISGLKTNGKLINNNILNMGSKDDESKNNENIIVSEENLVCTKMDSEVAGNFEETYTFYYNNGRLENVKNDKIYDAVADSYLNYVYSEKSKFDNMNDLYQNVPGFSYDSNLEGKMLHITFYYDLTKLNKNLLHNESEDLSIDLNVNIEETLDDVKLAYESSGYKCR